ncbi:MAG: tRNA adenosine(34) deaminase TadA [Christensenellales bacterium]
MYTGDTGEINSYFMLEAIKEARKAAKKDEVPVGAVIVQGGRIIARGHNVRESKRTPLGHAEIVAIGKAAKKLGGWRLINCEMYVTLEPCPMCTGAALQSRIAKICYGAPDPKAGCCGSLYRLHEDKRFNHTMDVKGPMMATECLALLKEYFEHKRAQDKQKRKNLKVEDDA